MYETIPQPDWRLFARADQHSAGVHWLEPGEVCLLTKPHSAPLKVGQRLAVGRQRVRSHPRLIKGGKR